MTRTNMLPAFGLMAALAFAAPAGGQQIPGERPAMWVDYDEADIAEPKEGDRGYYYDFLDGTFFQQVKQGFDFPRMARKLAGRPKQALNVNRERGVPDSSWFTNRNGRRRMTLEEISRGPDEDSGPAGEKYLVLRGKTVGITPGLWIKDERGRTYLLKFDPPEYPELATAAEVISTKLFYAIGYNVPENTIFHFRRDQLVLDDWAGYRDSQGRMQPLTEEILDQILENTGQERFGKYRAVASQQLPGKPKGGFSFHGVRDDDANDIIPHEHRRDLRALRVFSAWLEHNDIRVGNTLDMYMSEGGRRFLRHYLIDFGSTLGSDTVFPNRPKVGHAHIVDMREAGITLLTLGIKQPAWTRPEPVLFRSVGRYGAVAFDPRKWKSNFPLVAFENMTEEDALWAAEIVASFTDEQIRAAVDTGQLSDSAAAAYLAEQLMARRDRIVETYLEQDTRRQVRSTRASKLPSGIPAR